jgi:hypothetical protein
MQFFRRLCPGYYKNRSVLKSEAEQARTDHKPASSLLKLALSLVNEMVDKARARVSLRP